MQVEFETVDDTSLPVVKRIYDWYILHSTATFHTEPITIDQLKEFIFINHPLYRSFIIKYDQQIAGYCYLTYFKKRQAYDRTAEVTIYLDPLFCQRGIGKIAIAYLENIARENGLKTLIATISGNNQGSITLFEHAGFIKCAHFTQVGEKFGQLLDVVGYQKIL